MENKTKQTKKTGYKILLILFLAGFVLSMAALGYRYTAQKKAEKQYDRLADKTTESTAETVTETEQPDGGLSDLGIVIPGKKIDWAALKEENEDIYAWIYIPNTQVDYPVVQHPTDDQYYLNHNLDGSAGYPGCIYSQSLNRKDFTDSNTVLYGHNMKNGSMFATLHQFEDKDFFEENPYIYIYTPEKTYVYTIYAACTAGNKHLLHAYDFDTETGFEQFVTDINSVRDMSSHVRNGVGMVYGRKLVTLSTCMKGQPDNRWIVTAVLLNE